MMTRQEFREKYMPHCFDGNEISEKYAEYFKENVAVGDGVTVHLYTDAHAYTVIARTAKTLTLRRCKCTQKTKLEWEVGGFSAVCLNNSEQEWDYEEDENGEIVKAYWSDRKCGFYVDHIERCSYGRHEFYDYNF